ncbi:hypothetical protein Csa_003919, partial [Cucumis sativus]
LGRRKEEAPTPAKKMVVKFNENEDYEALRELFRHHIESFDHLVDAGLETLMNSIKPVEIYDSFTNKKLRNILIMNLYGLLFLFCYILYVSGSVPFSVT